MKTLALALFLALSSVARAEDISPALRQACIQQLPPSSLDFVVPSVEPVVEQRLGFSELRTLVTAAPKDAVLGATAFTPDIEVEWGSRSVMDTHSGMLCTRVMATIRLGVSPQAVHIAREIPPGSCPYQVVLNHELGHVEINNAQLRQVAQTLNALARAEFAAKAWFGTAEAIGEAVRAEITTVWLGRAEALLLAARNLHASHDQTARQSDSLAACVERPPRVTARAGY